MMFLCLPPSLSKISTHIQLRILKKKKNQPSNEQRESDNSVVLPGN